MRHGAKLVLLLVAGLFAPSSHVSSLYAQDDDLARVRARYDAETVAAIEAVIADAEADGVPRSLLVSKAVEGAAKRTPGAIVVEGVGVWADELRVAVDLLGRGAEPEGLAKAAESISHGVDPDVVSGLATAYPAEFPIMLQTIEDLVHQGVELDEAQAMVADAAERGFDSQDVLTLSATLRRLVREGSTPVEAADRIRLDVRSGSRTVIPPPPPTRRPPFPNAGSRPTIPPPPPPF